MSKLGIECSYLLKHRSPYDVFVEKDQYIEIEGSKITKIENISSANKKAKQIISLKHHLVCPGFINTHTHLPMTLFRGLFDDEPLFEWLTKYIFPLEGKFISPEFVKIGAELAALECIYSGITTVADMYFFEDEIGEVFDRAGLRGFFGEGISSQLRDFEEKVDKLCEKFYEHPRIHPALAPHAPYTCDEELLKNVASYSQRRNVPILMHVSETEKEVQDIKKQYGKTPVAFLDELGITGENSLFVHCVWLSKEDKKILKQTNTAVSYNPQSNMKLGSGVSPAVELLKSGVRIGLGTDGSASNNNINIVEEMGVGGMLQKLSLKNNSEMKAKTMIGMATLGGAKTLNLDKVGSIQEGYLADIVGIDIDQPHMQPTHDLVSHLVYSATGGEIDFVMCHGKILMREGKQKVLSEKEVFSKVETIRKDIHSFLESKI